MTVANALKIRWTSKILYFARRKIWNDSKECAENKVKQYNIVLVNAREAHRKILIDGKECAENKVK